MLHDPAVIDSDSETAHPLTLVGTDGVISSLGSIIVNRTCTYTSFL